MTRNLCFIAALILSSCTVKENRSVCPCELLVRSEEALKTDGGVLVSVVQDGKVVGQGTMGREDFENGGCRFTVPRRPSTVTVFSGITSMDTAGGRMLGIPRDFQCDEIYSTAVSANLKDDSQECTVSLHKNFARLFLKVIGKPDSAELRIMGLVAGYDILSLEPQTGDFDFMPSGGTDGTDYCEVRIPRQKDDALTLHVKYEEGRMRNIPLGMLIVESGYSFEDADLSDISVTVDLSKSYALVGVLGWNTETYSHIEF